MRAEETSTEEEVEKSELLQAANQAVQPGQQGNQRTGVFTRPLFSVKRETAKV
jgi:hypothetical protein